MYSDTPVLVGKTHPLTPYCDSLSVAANSLRNATLYVMRQVMTATKKDPKDWYPNEREVMQSIEDALPAMNAKGKHTYVMPTQKKWFLSYNFLDAYMRVTKNPDFFNDALPKQSAQEVLKTVVKDMKGYCKSCKEYAKHPEKYDGKPKLPHYRKKPGSRYTVPLTNQDCVIYQDEDGKVYAKLPLTKEKCYLKETDGRLKDVEIKPHNGVYTIHFHFEDDREAKPLRESKRCIAIDLGVTNFASITNNFGEVGLLFKGGLLKSRNQWYNKRVAKIVSEQTKGTTNKFVPTDEYYHITLKRENQINDILHKYAKMIIQYCVEHDVDTLVVGRNKGWKQECPFDKVNTQNFVQLPFFKFQKMLEYLCEWNSINYILYDESYTSKASFLDKDDIPTYQEGNDAKYHFSGKRVTRGKYKTKDGRIINADLNGSANIGRKALGDELYQNVNFGKPLIIKHPYRNDQKEKPISKSKERRINRKIALA